MSLLSIRETIEDVFKRYKIYIYIIYFNIYMDIINLIMLELLLINRH